MEKIQISDVFNCNRTLSKLFKSQNEFPISVGFKLFKITKLFDEVEEYVFSIMSMTFDDFSFDKMTHEQIEFFNLILNERIELEYDKISIKSFENSCNLKLSMDEIQNLRIILKENDE